MSRSPLDGAGESEPYLSGWKTINRLVREGYSWSGYERNRAFLNLGGMRFADVSGVAGLDAKDDGRAVALVDWDFDGDLDLLFTHRTAPRLRMSANRLDQQNGFLPLLLAGRAPNTQAIGARVEVRPEPGHDEAADEGRTLASTRRAGEGFLAQSSAWMHFGLGDAPSATVRVRWPDGTWESFGALEAGARYVLTQGTGAAQPWSPPGGAQQALTAAPVLPPPPSGEARIVLPRPLPMPALRMRTGDGRDGSLFGVRARLLAAQQPQRPLLIKLWASWCAPCHEELKGWGAFQAETQDPGFEMLALGVEEPAARERAAHTLERFGWRAPSAYTAEDTLAVLDAMQAAILARDRPIPVPSSYLVDGRGDLVALYLGPVDPDRVRADLALLDLAPEERRARASPFPGRWHRPLEDVGVTMGRLEEAFARRGLTRTAREYQAGWIQLVAGRVSVELGDLEQAERFFRRAQATGPYDREAQAGLAEVLHLAGIQHARSGRIEDAREHLQRLRGLSEERAEALAALLRRLSDGD